MNEKQELASAVVVLACAKVCSKKDNDEKDHDAATVAILMKAFELATQDLSPERRNQLLKGEWE